MRIFKASGQHLTEFAMLLAAVGTVILAMQIYGQRALQARYKSGTDYLFSQIEQEAVKQKKASLQNLKTQYDPYYLESQIIEMNDNKNTTGFPDSSADNTGWRGGWQKVNSPGNND